MTSTNAALFPTLLMILPVMLISVILPIGLTVALQVWLCRRGKWLGLILPAISLVMSLVLCLSMAAFSTCAGGGSVRVSDEHGNVVEEHHTRQEGRELQLASLAPAAVLFLACNVPTVVFGGIWLYYKNRREWKDDLRKMNIEDLE